MRYIRALTLLSTLCVVLGLTACDDRQKTYEEATPPVFDRNGSPCLNINTYTVEGGCEAIFPTAQLSFTSHLEDGACVERISGSLGFDEQVWALVEFDMVPGVASDQESVPKFVPEMFELLNKVNGDVEHPDFTNFLLGIKFPKQEGPSTGISSRVGCRETLVAFWESQETINERLWTLKTQKGCGPASSPLTVGVFAFSKDEENKVYQVELEPVYGVGSKTCTATF